MINIDKLEELPHKENSKLYFTNRGLNMWDIRERHYWPQDVNPYTIADRIVNHYKGKSFDEAFSHYCPKVEQRYQHIFLEYFDRGRGWYGSYWYLDEQNRIQEVKSKKRSKRVTIASEDYKVEMRHRITGDDQEKFEGIWLDPKRKNYYGAKPDFYVYKYRKNTTKHSYWDMQKQLVPRNMMYKATKDDFIPVVVSGWMHTFSSKADPRYKRWMAEKDARIKKERKLKLFEAEEKLLERLRLDALKRKRLETANLVNIERHGFDPKTSFTKRKET